MSPVETFMAPSVSQIVSSPRESAFVFRPSPVTAKFSILIPAWKPLPVLLDMARELTASGETGLVIVDDGSGPEYAPLFDALAALPRVRVIHHAVNLGKGAALKTGMNIALTGNPSLAGVVTADADGQHAVEDILRVGRRLAAHPDRLILGVRQFDGSVPLRNRLGNLLTRAAVRLLMGQKLKDTQTGLRGIPSALMLELLRVPASGYEFELDMLTAAKHAGIRLDEEPIRTIYDHPGRVSHFNPLIDSMKIYFVLLRYGSVSLMSAVLDNLLFFLIYRSSGFIGLAQICARCVSLIFNYSMARRAVFLSRERHKLILPRYLALAAANALISYSLINLLAARLHVPVMGAKLLAESLLFLANFAIQRDFVFTKRNVSGGAPAASPDLSL